MITQFRTYLFLALGYGTQVIAYADNFGCLRQIFRIIRSYLRPKPDGFTLSLDMRSFWILDVPRGIGVKPGDQPVSLDQLNRAGGSILWEVTHDNGIQSGSGEHPSVKSRDH